MNGDNVAIGGVVLLPLIVGLVEFLKRLFNAPNNVWLVLSMVLGVGGWIINQRIALGMWPTTFESIAEMVVVGLAFGLAASKAYDETLKKLRSN